MNRASIRRFLFLLAAALFLLAAQAQAEKYFSTISFVMNGTPVKGETAAVLETPGGKAFAKLKSGASCRIVGHSGAYYRVEYQGKTGYVAQKLLTLKGKQATGALPEENLSELKMSNAVPRRKAAETIELKGTIRSKKKLDSLYVFIWDARKLRVEKALFIPLKTVASTVSVSSIQKQLTADGITAGRKLLVIEGSSAGEMTVLWRKVYAVRGKFHAVSHITGKCRVSDSAVLTLDRKKYWQPASDKAALTVDIPANVHPKLMTMEWRKIPDAFTVTFLDGKGKTISRKTESTGFYQDAVTVPSDARKITITLRGAEASMICLRLYPSRYAEHAVQRWEKVPDEVDLMVVSAHQDDELLFLGGSVPYYCIQGKKVAMVYMASDSRERCREALDGMWTAGLKYHPIFVGWHDAKVRSLGAAERIWRNNNGGKDPRIRVVRLIRQYKPKVIVTQDFNGEYGHNQHKLTARLWADAVELCKDPSFDPSSAKQYGVWDVKKLYIHLYRKNQITINWSAAIDPDTGLTALELAKDAFDKHSSQQDFYTLEKYGTWYDNTKFGLYYTSVGPDVKKDDFFENVP